MKKVYMAVTNDKYELPVYMTSYMKSLAKWAGVSYKAASTAISKGYSGKRSSYKLIKVMY